MSEPFGPCCRRTGEIKSGMHHYALLFRIFLVIMQQKYGLKLWQYYLTILPYNLDSSGEEAIWEISKR